MIHKPFYLGKIFKVFDKRNNLSDKSHVCQNPEIVLHYEIMNKEEVEMTKNKSPVSLIPGIDHFFLSPLMIICFTLISGNCYEHYFYLECDRNS